MNFLFVAEDEITDIDASAKTLRAQIVNQRARQARDDHALGAGLEIACVVQNKGRGKVSIMECSQDRIVLQARLEQDLISKLKFDLAVAYSRPQTVKKILQLASSAGIRSLSFVRTANVVPSYLQSRSLGAEQIRKNLILGCEQSGEAVFPEIHFFKSLSDFLASKLAANPDSARFFGDAGPAVQLSGLHNDVLLFLGPESGFSMAEKARLKESGFGHICLGPRILRLEVAAATLIGSYLGAS